MYIYILESEAIEYETIELVLNLQFIQFHEIVCYDLYEVP